MDISQSKTTRLLLSQSLDSTGQTASWIGPLLALGTRASRYSSKLEKRQLVVAVSVPIRDFAAVLIGCGWVLASKPKQLDTPLEVLRKLQAGDIIRVLNSSEIIVGRFSSLSEDQIPPRANFAGSEWNIERIKAVLPIDDPGYTARSLHPELSAIHRFAGLAKNWESHLAGPTADLGIVGTLTWINEEMKYYLGLEHDPYDLGSLDSVLLPKYLHVATWYTHLYHSTGFDERLDAANNLRSIILDGNGAISHLNELESSVIFCVIDRSLSDDTGAEVIKQLRNMRGTPLSLADDLRWNPPRGIEALAFTVPQ
ncbi:hypothetical protein [Arthrobacter sp. MYb214]|uniref:hypothetical protein n=1 Tax=Arthrobacter sp. MYb214 TaxID=1848596 RepID=UPI0011AFEC74|nr:hypothetical protein [Arthrobacter sp. MYb214]